MKNVTSENLKRNLKIFVSIYVICIAISLFIAVMTGLALSEFLYAVLFAFAGIAIYSVAFLPFIIYFAHVKKRFKEVMLTAEVHRGVLLGFRRSFILGTSYGYMEIDGEIYRTHSIFTVAAYRKINGAFALINKEVSYVSDGDKIYLIGE